MQSKWETTKSSSYLLQLILSVCENTRRLCECQRPRRHVWHSRRLNKHKRAGFKGKDDDGRGTEQQLSVAAAAPGGTGCTNNGLLFEGWSGNRSHMPRLHYSLLFKYKDLIGSFGVCVSNCVAKYSTKDKTVDKSVMRVWSGRNVLMHKEKDFCKPLDDGNVSENSTLAAFPNTLRSWYRPALVNITSKKCSENDRPLECLKLSPHSYLQVQYHRLRACSFFFFFWQRNPF